MGVWGELGGGGGGGGGRQGNKIEKENGSFCFSMSQTVIIMFSQVYFFIPQSHQDICIFIFLYWKPYEIKNGQVLKKN